MKEEKAKIMDSLKWTIVYTLIAVLLLGMFLAVYTFLTPKTDGTLGDNPQQEQPLEPPTDNGGGNTDTDNSGGNNGGNGANPVPLPGGTVVPPPTINEY